MIKDGESCKLREVTGEVETVLEGLQGWTSNLNQERCDQEVMRNNRDSDHVGVDRGWIIHQDPIKADSGSLINILIYYRSQF